MQNPRAWRGLEVAVLEAAIRRSLPSACFKETGVSRSIIDKPCIEVNVGSVYNRKKGCLRPILSSISKGFVLWSSMALIPTEAT